MINIKSLPLKLLQVKFDHMYAINLFSSSKIIKNTHTNKRNLKGDATLKNYFNKRSEMQHTDFVQLLEDLKSVKVSKTFFHDQRWVHLNVLIEKNLGSFSIKQQLKILNCLTKMRNFNDLFLTIHANLFNKLEQLDGNQKAFLIYYLGKMKKSKPHIYKPISDSLIQNLKQPGMKISFGKFTKTERKEQKQREYGEQEQSESIFEEIQMEKNVVEGEKQIDCRLLVLCVWSLHEMKIKDDLLSDLILKQIIKPNIGSISCELFPLLLSTLWVYKMQNKRIFEQITRQLLRRQKQLMQLDKDKLKMLICMLCKPEIQKSAPTNSQQQNKLRQTRKKLVLWLMQTLVLQHQSNQIFILSTSAYRILSNAYSANFYDAPLYAKYIKIISQDLSRIQTKQVIYLLSLVQNLRKNSKVRKQSRDQQQKLICEREYQILADWISRKILSFLHQTNEQHSARIALRHLVLTNFIEVNKNIKRNLLYEEKQFRTKKYNRKEEEPKQQKQSLEKPKVHQKRPEKQKKVSQSK